VAVENQFNSHRDLKVWQAAMSIAERCYVETRSFPREELFGMTSQIRRSAASIAANIAEGHGRETTRYFIQFLRTAQGSTKELETHLLLAQRVNLMGSSTAETLLASADELGKMLRALIRSLERKDQ
jgi:four helix bundle protein